MVVGCGVVFDMDGTLVNTEPVHFDAWNVAVAEFGLAPFGHDFFVPWVGKSVGAAATAVVVPASRQPSHRLFYRVPQPDMAPGTGAITGGGPGQRLPRGDHHDRRDGRAEGGCFP